MASASISVLFRLPFSPTRNVTADGLSNAPSAMIRAMQGVVYGQAGCDYQALPT
ncbi:MAG TPA: hypothetical protein VJS45_17740 [Acidimicrobiia bacterium]|nr:hypothetical protein [Acidimicrobiia bacterium]